MKISTDLIFKSIITIFIISSLINSIFKSTSFISLLLNSYFENIIPYIQLSKESSLAFLAIPPLISIFNKKRKIINQYIIFTLFIILTFLIISFFSNIYSFNLTFYLFFWRWIWPLFLSIVYIRSDLFFTNKNYILKIISFTLIIFSVFTIENVLTGACAQYRCNSIFFSPNTLGFNSLCCILITYKLLGKNLFTRKYIIFYLIPALLILISLSVANLLALIIFSIPYAIAKNRNIINLKVNKSLFLGLIIFSPLLILSTNFLLMKGVFNFRSDYFNYSIAERFKILIESAYNVDGSFNIFGQPGVYTNIGRIYNSEIGKVSDSILASLIGNFGLIIMPFLIVISIIVINNYFIIFNNNFKLLDMDYGYRGLIIASIFISGLGANIFEVFPMGSLLGCIIFTKIENLNPKII